MICFTLGSAPITVFNAGDIRADLAEWFGLDAEDWPQHHDLLAQPVAVSMNAVHIVLGDASVLIDAPRWHVSLGADYMLPAYIPPPDVSTQLRSAGIAPESITHVVITHAHFDHFNGLIDSSPSHGQAIGLRFPNARHYIGRADWDAKLCDADGETKAIFDALDTHSLLVRVEHDHTIASGIDILAAPGETPGHQIVRLHNDDQSLYIIGDLVHHAVEFTQPNWNVTWADARANQISRTRFMAAAQVEDAHFVAGHIRGVGRFNRVNSKVVWHDAKS